MTRTTTAPETAGPADAALDTEPAETELAESAEQIAAAVIGMMRQFNGIKSRVTGGPESEHWDLFLLVKLVSHGPRRASDLAELLCADPSTVSRQVASLVRAGLIERKADPDDGRASILVPTALGEARVQEHFVNRGQSIEPMIADWPDSDRVDFLRLLRSYSSRLE